MSLKGNKGGVVVPMNARMVLLAAFVLAGLAAGNTLQVGVGNYPPEVGNVSFEFEDLLNHSMLDSVIVTARFSARDINGVRELNRTKSYCIWENTTQEFFYVSSVDVTGCGLVDCSAACSVDLSPFDLPGTYWVTVSMEDTRKGLGTRRVSFEYENPCGTIDCPAPKPRKRALLPWEEEENIVWSGTPEPQSTAKPINDENKNLPNQLVQGILAFISSAMGWK